ncbi:hypothetical protein [Shimia sp. MIT1388]|uniref:hypothetical protein n=1 Tax=Shimia sp. MIT1388 TaxID=3096992 RepID=UPI00399A7F53
MTEETGTPHLTTSFGENYRFSDKQLPNSTVDKADPKELVRLLEALVAQQMAANSLNSYDDIRGKYIALNRALNRRGHIAPRFRPSLSGGKHKVNRSHDQNLISNDHQVLDLEWLNCQCGFKDDFAHHLPPRWVGIFGPNLDFELASLFAGTAGSADNKAADILELPLIAQMQLRAIQSQKVRYWWRDRRQQMDILRQGIRAKQPTTSAWRGNEVVWPKRWLAAKCAGYAGGSASEWSELIEGGAVAPTTISGVKKRCDTILRDFMATKKKPRKGFEKTAA